MPILKFSATSSPSELINAELSLLTITANSPSVLPIPINTESVIVSSLPVIAYSPGVLLIPVGTENIPLEISFPISLARKPIFVVAIDAYSHDPRAQILRYLPVTSIAVNLTLYNPWHTWAADPSLAQMIYIFTLTGAPDGLADIEIPISSIQCRLRDGEPTYLSVVIPSATWAADISARPGGELVVERGYRFSDGSRQLQEIARVDLEDIRMDSGARNKSITLSGHATISNTTPKAVAISGASYRSESNGKRRYRCTVDHFLRPGDTAVISDEEIIVDSISFTIGTSQEQMEISEA